jgi:tetraether lipid synthase
LIEQLLGKMGCCGGNCETEPDAPATETSVPLLALRAGQPGNGDVAGEFFARALAEQLSPSDVFRITITSFLDAYNFDVRRLMKCCVHFVLPSGHVVPFCAYNVLYREGHAVLPALRQVETQRRASLALVE